LAAEVEARYEEVADVALAADLAAEVVVEVLEATGQLRVGVAFEPLAPAHGLHHRVATVLLRVPEQRREVELVRVRRLDRLPVALLPVADEVRVEHARPADAALEEGEVQVREPARHAAEEEGLRDRVAGRGEVTDVVEAEVRRRVAEQDRARAVVKARRDAELAALDPHRIVVVVAVDDDHVVPLGERAASGCSSATAGTCRRVRAPTIITL